MINLLKSLYKFFTGLPQIINENSQTLLVSSQTLKDNVVKERYEQRKQFYVKHNPHNPNPSLDEINEFWQMCEKRLKD